MAVQDSGGSRPGPVVTIAPGGPADPDEAAMVRLWRVLRHLRLLVEGTPVEGRTPEGDRTLQAMVRGAVAGPVTLQTPVQPTRTPGEQEQIAVEVTMALRLPRPGIVPRGRRS